jgi:predicted transposase YbfD/YdcC
LKDVVTNADALHCQKNFELAEKAGALLTTQGKKQSTIIIATNKAHRIAEYIRSHWYIENKLHHIKDRDYMEDKTPKRGNPYVFSYCIDISINALRSEKVTNIREALYNRGELEECVRYLL